MEYYTSYSDTAFLPVRLPSPLLIQLVPASLELTLGIFLIKSICWAVAGKRQIKHVDTKCQKPKINKTMHDQSIYSNIIDSGLTHDGVTQVDKQLVFCSDWFLIPPHFPSLHDNHFGTITHCFKDNRVKWPHTHIWLVKSHMTFVNWLLIGWNHSWEPLSYWFLFPPQFCVFGGFNVNHVGTIHLMFLWQQGHHVTSYSHLIG